MSNWIYGTRIEILPFHFIIWYPVFKVIVYHFFFRGVHFQVKEKNYSRSFFVWRVQVFISKLKKCCMSIQYMVHHCIVLQIFWPISCVCGKCNMNFYMDLIFACQGLSVSNKRQSDSSWGAQEIFCSQSATSSNPARHQGQESTRLHLVIFCWTCLS